MLADGYFDGLQALVIEDLVEVADEFGVGLLVQMDWHYFVNLGQRTIDNDFVFFFDVAPHLHLLEVFSWNQLLEFNQVGLLEICDVFL